MKPTTNGKTTGFAKWLRVLGLVFFLFVVFRYVDLERFSENLKNANGHFLILGIFTSLLIVPLAAIRLRLFLLCGKVDKKLLPCSAAVLCGLALNLLLPARGGDIAKVAFLRNSPEDKWTTLTGICLLERGFDVLSLSFIGLFASLIFNFFECTIFSCLTALTAGIGILAITRTDSIPVIGKKLSPLAAVAVQSFKRPRTLLKAFAASLACCLNNVLLMGFLLKATDPLAQISHSFAVSPIAAIAGSLPVSPWGLGTRDGTLVYLLRDHLPTESTLAASFLYMVSTQLILGFIGVPILLIQQRKFSTQGEGESIP